MISFRHVSVPTSIQVFNIGGIPNSNIELYFEHTKTSGGGEIKQFTMNEQHGYAIIEFYDSQGQYFVMCDRLTLAFVKASLTYMYFCQLLYDPYLCPMTFSICCVLCFLWAFHVSDTSLHDVFRATILAKLTYAVPAWSGACSAGDLAKLNAFVNRCRRLGYCSQNELSLTELMDDADDRLFRRIMYNREHVLQPFLPDRPILSYNLRRRPHCNKSLITKTADLSNNDYIIRAIYKDSY